MHGFTVLALVSCAFAAPSNDNPNIPTSEGRIVGGSTVSIKDIPYQLSLRVDNVHHCGASIISANWAVTSAHCVHGLSASRMSLRAGSSLHASGGSLHPVSMVIAHEKYVDDDTFDYDIAVLSVTSAFNLGTVGVQTISLPSDNQQAVVGGSVRVSGWGFQSSGSTGIPDQLQAAHVSIVSQSSCRNSYGTLAITDRMLCAASPAGGKAACRGDDGGPLESGYTLVGVASWRKGCAQPGFPGVYADVGNLRKWIRDQTGI